MMNNIELYHMYIIVLYERTLMLHLHCVSADDGVGYYDGTAYP